MAGPMPLQVEQQRTADGTTRSARCRGSNPGHDSGSADTLLRSRPNPPAAAGDG